MYVITVTEISVITCISIFSDHLSLLYEVFRRQNFFESNFHLPGLTHFQDQTYESQIPYSESLLALPRYRQSTNKNS